MVEVGSHVTFVDSRGVERPALVTAVWSETCINVVYVNGDEAQRDDWGRKIARMSSVVHQKLQSAHGNYWK